jgi:hypothetical protein
VPPEIELLPTVRPPDGEVGQVAKVGGAVSIRQRAPVPVPPAALLNPTTPEPRPIGTVLFGTCH